MTGLQDVPGQLAGAQAPRRMLDVLYVGTLPPHPGGSAMVGAQVVAGLAQRGHRVRALAPMAGSEAGRPDAFALRHPEVEVMRYEVPYFNVVTFVKGPDDYFAVEVAQVRRLMPRLIAQRRPDVVVAGREAFAWCVPEVAEARELPCALLAQHGQVLRILRDEVEAGSAPAVLERYRGLDLLVLVAHHLLPHAHALGLRNAHVIQNTVDPAVFRPGPRDPDLMRTLEIRDDDVVVAHVSNLKPVKRPLDLVESARLALRRDPRLLYLVVGDGPLRAEMEAACREAGVAARFRFTGWVDYDDLPRYLNLADLVVMPSEAEALALVYLEAQACGRVLLASDVPAAQEVIVDGETGLLFRMGDVQDLADVTLRAVRDPALCRQIGRGARMAAEARSVTGLAEAYERLLREVVDRGRGRE